MTDINKQIEEASWDYLNPDDGDIIDFNDQAKLESFKQGAQWMLKKLERSSRWRKVSEGLPEMGYRVLIRNEFKVSHLGYIDTVGDWRYCLNNELIKDKLLEWKPID